MTLDSTTVANPETETLVTPIATCARKATIGVTRDRLYSALKSVSLASCKDETRFHLTGVYLELDGKRLTLVATDGHTLHRAVIEVAIEVHAVHSALLKSEDVSAILKAVKPKKAEQDQIVSVAFTEAYVAKGTRAELAKPHQPTSKANVSIACGSTLLSCTPLDANFPPYRQVIPDFTRSGLQAATIGFNPAYLARACDAIKEFGRDAYSGIGASINYGQELDPIRIDFMGRELGEFTAVVMPMRIK
jgi:DNA polymerase III sliding clamp (beta) subunit (PCNA family)